MTLNYSMPQRQRPPTLPGDNAGSKNAGNNHATNNNDRREVARMIRVDQAGEMGAKAIYAGQMAVLKDQPCAPVLAEMAAQETEHLEVFDQLVLARNVRPSALSPLWRRAGYAIGVTSALMGERAAMAVTVAVEDVIAEHYQEQLDHLGEDETELRTTIAKFRDDELQHRATALENGAEEVPAYQILSRSVKAGTKLAIWLAKRI